MLAAVVRVAAVVAEAVEAWGAHPVGGVPVYQAAPIEVVPIGHPHIAVVIYHGVTEREVADMGTGPQLYRPLPFCFSF